MKTQNNHDRTVDTAQFNSTMLHIGELFVTPGVLRSISCDDLTTALSRHQARDWGEVGEEDWQANDCALQHGGRLFSTAKKSAISTRHSARRCRQ